jgi:hypothetical protein
VIMTINSFKKEKEKKRGSRAEEYCYISLMG